MQTEKFIRKVRPVEAVKVTAETMEELATWCGGLVIPAPGLAGENNSEPYVHVPVRNPRRPEDKRAFPGMWIIREDFNNHRVVTNKQFKNSYDAHVKTKSVTTQAPQPAKNPGAVMHAMASKSDPSGHTTATPKPTQVGAVQVVPGTPPEAGSQLTTGSVSVENTVEHAAEAGLITQADAAEARSEIAEIRDEAAHDAVARDIAQAEVDGDMVQLGQPIVNELCDECGSAVVDGVCTNVPTHIIVSAAEIAPTPRIVPGD